MIRNGLKPTQPRREVAAPALFQAAQTKVERAIGSAANA